MNPWSTHILKMLNISGHPISESIQQKGTEGNKDAQGYGIACIREETKKTRDLKLEKQMSEWGDMIESYKVNNGMEKVKKDIYYVS